MRNVDLKWGKEKEIMLGRRYHRLAGHANQIRSEIRMM